MNFLKKSAAALAVLALASSAMAQQNSDSASSSAAAEIVSAIAIVNDAGLHFGDVVAGGTAGTVVLSVAGARSVTGGVTLGNGGAAQAAQFTVTGDSGATYAVTLPASTTISAGANSMVVNTFTQNAVGTLTGGTEVFNVGATLNVGVSQPSGSYTGTFNVTVAYN